MHKYGTSPYTQYCVMFTCNCDSSQYPKSTFLFPSCRVKDLLSTSLKDNFSCSRTSSKTPIFCILYTLFVVIFPPNLDVLNHYSLV